MTKAPEIFCQQAGLTFNHLPLLVMALTHRSVGAKNNERLEFLGDSILGFVIAEKLYVKFPTASEGVLSRLRANLVNQESLAGLARSMDIGSYLIMGSGELKSGGYRRDSILSDALESIIGALFIDQGFVNTQEWVLKIFAEKINLLTMDNWQKDPKTQLQEYMQSRRLELPVYSLITQVGLAHSQTFEIECHIPLINTPTLGTGLSRKKAEQHAAQLMLAKLAEMKSKKT